MIGIIQPDTFAEAVYQCTLEANQILHRKRAMRGTSNISEQGVHGVLLRMQKDKLSRLLRSSEDALIMQGLEDRGVDTSQLKKRDGTPAFVSDDASDSFDDDLLDVMNYAIIALCLRRGWWDLP